MQTSKVQLIKGLYDRFNARDIKGVLSAVAKDVEWANAMEGGHVHGHEGIRDYWTRQWAMISPHVEPVAFTETVDGVVVEVIQSVFDLNGQPLVDQSQGLKDKTVFHIFKFSGDKIKCFDVEDRS